MSSNEHNPLQLGERSHQQHPEHHHNRRGQGYRHNNRGRGRGNQKTNPEQSEVDALFSKAFTFQKTEPPWTLPNKENLFFSPESASPDDWNEGLSDLRSKLRLTQERLSDKEILEWHTHTGSTHRGGLVITELKKRFHIELGTQAWSKFHEILATRHLIPDSALNSGTLHSLHICEAPGAFISSLNHYIKTHKDKEIIQWKWLGTSLNPHCETNTADCTIVDDRLILQTPDCWYFGDDNTGDVMSAANLAGLERLIQQEMNGTVHLVTADGSVNCQDDPEHQEHRVFPLVFCQSLTALKLLAPEGAFLVKMFTMYNANTACLMNLLNIAFKEVTVLKPACSKAGNSEVYVMCKSYLGRDHLQPQLDTLLQHFGPDVGKTPLFSPAHLPESFVTQLEKCSLKFTNYQVAAIEENLQLYPNMDPSSRQRIDRVRAQCVEMFIKRCRLRVARKHQKLMPNYGSKACSMFKKNMWHRLHGSLDDRGEVGHRSWKEHLQSILRDLQQQGYKAGLGGDSQRGSSPKKMRSSVSVSDQLDSSELEGGDSHQTNAGDARLGGGGDGLGLGSGPGPENTGPTIQAIHCDQPSSAVRCHGDGGHVGRHESAMEVCDHEQRTLNPVQTSSVQASVGVAGIVGDVAAMDVGSPETTPTISTTSLQECAWSHLAEDASVRVSHSDYSRIAKTVCALCIHSKMELSEDPNVGGEKQHVLDGAVGGQRSTTNETTEGRSSEIFTVQIPWITPGKHDLDSLGSWKIVTGHPVRAVFMSPFCQMPLLDKWRSVRTNAQVLQQSTGHNVKGHPQCDLSPQIYEVIEGLLSKRPVPSSGQEESWCCSGVNKQELDLLDQLASTHNAVIKSCRDNNPRGEMFGDIQHLLEREADGKRRFKSFFFKLLPSCIARETEPTAGELETKQDFISACLLAIKELQAGGSLHIWVPGLLTRFSACIVYILSQAFDLLTLVRGQRSDVLTAPRVLINCAGFHPNPQIEQNFQRVYERMKELHQGGSHDVLRFIPMLSLFNPDFDKAITRFNENLIREDLLHIVKAELALLDDSDDAGLLDNMSSEIVYC
ncbi:uncharacterized protein LOC579852 [Strongylocentrotus purpuratus]|uniref:Cap-specific mRNA (nucleoside-2'-O-)-methyltransferase 2 n=1 Tax=Strongylocentrotus purpuratus TaxID=7668 RepID=A0A7M7P2U5_STRPU|nr:uncharacterized protein LOC579852 [Strongylocentrotus purpuratus]